LTSRLSILDMRRRLRIPTGTHRDLGNIGRRFVFCGSASLAFNRPHSPTTEHLLIVFLGPLRIGCVQRIRYGGRVATQVTKFP
jgi:hypothetical protein